MRDADETRRSGIAPRSSGVPCVRHRPTSPDLRVFAFNHLEKPWTTTLDLPVGQDVKSPTSYTALTPLAFLERSLDVFADKTAIAYGERRLTYSEFGAAATRLANALRASGIERGDRVAYLCPNIPEMLVANFGVPLAGAVMVPINTRLAAEEVRYICDHSGAKLLVADTEYLPALAPVLGTMQTVREVVALHDPRGPAWPRPPSTRTSPTTS